MIGRAGCGGAEKEGDINSFSNFYFQSAKDMLMLDSHGKDSLI